MIGATTIREKKQGVDNGWYHSLTKEQIAIAITTGYVLLSNFGNSGEIKQIPFIACQWKANKPVTKPGEIYQDSVWCFESTIKKNFPELKFDDKNISNIIEF